MKQNNVISNIKIIAQVLRCLLEFWQLVYQEKASRNGK